MGPERAGEGRGRPRLWHHDYLHLRPVARDLEARLGAIGPEVKRILDVGAGSSPYRRATGTLERTWIRLDLDGGTRPDVNGRAEALPFADATFDAVLTTQLLGLVEEPAAMAGEIARVLRFGGRAWVTAPAAWPYDSARVEHRFGEPELRALFSDLYVVEVARQGGMLGLPFALFNSAFREAVRAAERRVGPLAAPFRAGARAAFVVSNLVGRALEILAAGGPLAPFLHYLDARLPMNFLVVAEKRR